jgi:hypothetical protein
MRSSARARTASVALVLVVALSGAFSASAGAATGKTGPQVPGVGMGSKAALAQDTCDAASKRTSFASVGTGPFCVNPWPDGKDNGGATAPGVTATDVKVVVYYGNPAMQAAERASGGRLPTNRVTGQPGTWPDSFRESDEVVQYANEHFGTFQTWGRKPVWEFVEASGPDEAAQRADAIAVKAKKPFIVIDAAHQSVGAPVFEAEMAKAKIIVNGAGATGLTTADLERQAPYRWAVQSDSTANLYLVANFLSNSLSGRKAQWAGDDALKAKKRAFGVVYPQGQLDMDLFNSLVKKDGGTPAVSTVAYDPAGDPGAAAETAKTLVAQLKSKGVTTVVLFANASTVAAMTKAATENEFSPEWLVTGYQFQDFDGYGRTYDQDQFRHAFGLGVITPRPVAEPGSTLPQGEFDWYWGTTQGTFAATTLPWISFVYRAMQYAGPKLTAQNVKKGLFSVPAVGGASDATVSYQSGLGRTVGLPYDEYLSLGSDSQLLWWNPDLVSEGTNAIAGTPENKGRFMYLNDGKRYSFGGFPKTEPKFFDESASLYEFPAGDAYPSGTVPAAMPCTGCPSQGGSGAAP